MRAWTSVRLGPWDVGIPKISGVVPKPWHVLVSIEFLVQTVGHGVAIQVGCSIIWMSFSLSSEWTDNVTDRVSVEIGVPDFINECP
jgi:hypothetical protein